VQATVRADYTRVVEIATALLAPIGAVSNIRIGHIRRSHADKISCEKDKRETFTPMLALRSSPQPE
jgi:hypothetical protein